MSKRSVFPALSRAIETFIPIQLSGSPLSIWHDYLDLLRFTVTPLVEQLRTEQLITWYCFLVHNRTSGVPTHASDNNLYVHLRMAPAKGVTLKTLKKHLPSACKMTRRVPQPVPQALDRANVTAFTGGSVREGWKVLGDSSEWVLRMLGVHDQKNRIPVENVSQFLHYVGNQLLVQMVRIPMP